jgi:hypothetical protein
MSTDDQDSPVWELLCLRVTADSDPSVLPRLLGHFQNLNVTPRRIVAEFGTDTLMHLLVEISGLPAERLDLIAAKAGQIPCVVRAYWHYV